MRQRAYILLDTGGTVAISDERADAVRKIEDATKAEQVFVSFMKPELSGPSPTITIKIESIVLVEDVF